MRLFNIVPESFWEEFELDINSYTANDENLNGIDLDMVLSAHETMTNEIEESLNEVGASLHGQEFLEFTILASSLKILDFHLINGIFVDQDFNDLPIDVGNLKEQISNILKDRNKTGRKFDDKFGSRNKNGHMDLPEGQFDFDINDPMGSLAHMLEDIGNNSNWQDNAGIGHDGFVFAIAAVIIGVAIVFEMDRCNDNWEDSNKVAKDFHPVVVGSNNHHNGNGNASNNGNGNASNNASNNGNGNASNNGNGNGNGNDNGNGNGNGNGNDNGNDNGNGNGNGNDNGNDNGNTGCGKDQSCNNDSTPSGGADDPDPAMADTVDVSVPLTKAEAEAIDRRLKSFGDTLGGLGVVDNPLLEDEDGSGDGDSDSDAELSDNCLEGNVNCTLKGNESKGNIDVTIKRDQLIHVIETF